MEVQRGLVVGGGLCRGMQYKISDKQKERTCTQTYGDETTDEEKEEEVLPFGGRGFLRVHGHERCLLAARWPKDHGRRQNKIESCFFSFPFFTLLSLSLCCMSE